MKKHEYVDRLWLISPGHPANPKFGVVATYGQAMLHVLFVVMMWANIFPVI